MLGSQFVGSEIQLTAAEIWFSYDSRHIFHFAH